MIIYKDECVQCPPEMGCLGRTCPNRNVPHYICDRCKGEVEKLYRVYGDGREMCIDCIEETLEKVGAE